MFRLITTKTTVRYNDYQSATYNFYTNLGKAMIKKQTNTFDLYLNTVLLRRVRIEEGQVIEDYFLNGG